MFIWTEPQQSFIALLPFSWKPQTSGTNLPFLALKFAWTKFHEENNKLLRIPILVTVSPNSELQARFRQQGNCKTQNVYSFVTALD